MFNKKCGLLLTLLLLLVGVSGVCATDNNTDSLTTVEDNILCDSNKVVNLTKDNNIVSNDSVDLSTVPCAVSSYINVMKSYNKTVDVKTGIKETHTVDNVTSVDGLVNAFTNQGLKCNVIKTNIENLKELHKDKRNNIIVHMYIKNNYHFGHIKEIRKDGILFNDNFFIYFTHLKDCFTGITIIISNGSSLNLSCFGESVNKSEWVNITGKLTQRDLFNYNYGMVGKAISLNKKYSILKSNIKNGSEKRSIESIEFVLFGNTLKPNMATLLKIQKDLAPIYNNKHAPIKALIISNNVLTPMQHNLNETISSLDYLINMINKHNKDNLKASNVVSPKVVDVPKLLGSCGKAITENPVLKQFVKNFEDSVNNLNPLNAYPELREYYDEKYGLDHHKFGFIDYYTLK